MDFSNSPSNPENSGHAANLKPVRRRLQKLTPKSKLFGTKRSSHDSGISTGDSPSAPREMSTIGGTAVAGSLGHNPFADEPVLPLPPDLSDSKWLDYIERSGLMYLEPTVTESVPKPMRKKPPPIIPELSHLARPDGTRPSLDSASSGSAPHSASTLSTMRRQAKTPVFRIGQLEGKPLAGSGTANRFGRDPLTAEKTSSVELIAEQYCALLEHRDAIKEERERQLERQRQEQENDAASSIYTSSSSAYTGYQSEPAWIRPDSPIELPQEPLARYATENSRVNIILEPVRNSSLGTQQSPTSTDATYVGRDETAIYFKPVSLLQGPPAQFTQATNGTLSPTSGLREELQDELPDSLSLHICLDLLAKELASSFVSRSSRTGDSSTLQLWVMIEAYESLQNRIACTDELSGAQKSSIQRVLRSWLGTLYAVHDMLAGRSAADEREVEGLTEAVD